MTDIPIPPEALEAVAQVLHDHAEIFDDLPWEDLSEDDQECYIEEARAAPQAGLKAWPGIEVRQMYSVWSGKHGIILPLPTEKPHD